MSFDQFPRTVLRELDESLSQLDTATCEQAVTLITDADKVFVLGLGPARPDAQILCDAPDAHGPRVVCRGRDHHPELRSWRPARGGLRLRRDKQLAQIAEKARILGGRCSRSPARPDPQSLGSRTSRSLSAPPARTRATPNSARCNPWRRCSSRESFSWATPSYWLSWSEPPAAGRRCSPGTRILSDPPNRARLRRPLSRTGSDSGEFGACGMVKLGGRGVQVIVR